jgi:hypothetical protein
MDDRDIMSEQECVVGRKAATRVSGHYPLRVNYFNPVTLQDRGSIRCGSRFISCSELGCRTHAGATARYGDRYQVDARLITHTLNQMTRSRGRRGPMAFRKEFRHLLGRKLLRHHGAQITRTISKRHRPGYGRWTPSSGHPENAETRWSTAHAGGRVGVETADSRTGGFLPQPGGSLRQSLIAGAPW